MSASAGWALFIVVGLGWVSHARSQRREIRDLIRTLQNRDDTIEFMIAERKPG